MIVACFKHYVLTCLMALRGPTFLAFRKSLVESGKDCLLEDLIVLPRLLVEMQRQNVTSPGSVSSFLM